MSWPVTPNAHAKNYLIMIRACAPSLAPMYDVMCGAVWENVAKNLAQKIAGEGRGDHIKGLRPRLRPQS
jgi:serine/threonine-protein kinase HipA